jgi:hypothetical protein
MERHYLESVRKAADFVDRHYLYNELYPEIYKKIRNIQDLLFIFTKISFD